MAPPVTSSRFLWHQAWRAGRGRLILAVACSALASLCAVPLAFFLSRLIGSPPSFNPWIVAGIVGFALARALGAYVGESRAATLSASVRVHLRHALFSTLLERGPVALSQKGTAEVATSLIERVEALDGFITRYIPRAMAAAVALPVIILTLLFIDPWTAGALILAGVLAPVFMAFAGIAARRRSRRQYAQLDRLSNAFLDRLRNLVLLRTFGAVEREEKHLAVISETFRQRTMAVLRVAFLSSTSLELLAGLSLAFATLHVVRTSVPLPHAFFILLLVAEFFGPLRQLIAVHHERGMALAAADVIAPLLYPPPPSPLPSGTLPRPRFPLRSLQEPLAPPSIDMQSVCYTYPGRTQPALQDVSFHVSGGEFVALAGPTGAGKSTIMSLFLSFIRPEAGLIAVATHPLDSIEPEQRAHLFAWVGQRARLFHGTLADNIRFGQRHAREEDIRRAADQAGLSALVATLPQGLETPVGEQGFGLSGGQAQRVALARAFLRNAPILLLDEPTAGLDRDTAQALLATIRTLAQNRTVIMVSHNADALAAAERVIRLEPPPSRPLSVSVPSLPEAENT